MPAYRVLYTTVASTTVTVEADSPEEAANLADEQFEPPFVCAHCSGWNNSGNNSGIDLGEWQPVDNLEEGVWET